MAMMSFGASSLCTRAFIGHKQMASSRPMHTRVHSSSSSRLPMSLCQSYSSAFEDSLSPVFYSSSMAGSRAEGNPVSAHRPRSMPSAARAAFKALERESVAAVARTRSATTASATASAVPQQSALDTLCLVTYSDDEDTRQQHPAQQRVHAMLQSSMAAVTAAAVVVTPGRAAAVFAALNSEDHTDCEDDLPAVMETLCMLSYDEEAE